MGKICVGRVIGGGLVAGLVINICEFLVNGLWLAADWENAMRALGKPMATGALPMVCYNIWGFAMGIMAVWLYAAIRPRFGPGSKTAYNAAIAVWIPGYLLALVPPAIMGIFPLRLMLIGLAVGLVEVLIGAQLGAWIYKEESAPSGVSAAAGV
jgi:hypothetical protein